MADDEGAKALTIVGRIDNQVELRQDEADYFENAWDSIIEFFTVNTPAGKVRLLGKQQKAATKVQVMAFKANTGLVFEGNDPVNGFGVDIPIPEDVFVNAADNRWEFTSAGAGVIGSRFTRNWIGVAARDTIVGYLANSILLKDANNDPWSLMLYGIMDLYPGSGVVEGYVPILNQRPRALIPVSPWTYVTDISMRDVKRAYHIDPITPLQVDIQMKDLVATLIAPYPLSTVCRTARRALQRGTAVVGVTRPSVA
jgi:hypothetical protein